MSRTAAIVLLVGVTAAAVGVVASYLLGHAAGPRAAYDAGSAAAARAVPAPRLIDGPRIVFRHTGIDGHYGTVAMVPLDDPGGPRTFTPVACDRIDAAPDHAECLQTHQGARTTTDLVELDAAWASVDRVPLTGVPSRTRLSPDGSLVATTTFVSGHSYRQTGYSTSTLVRHVDGRSIGDLEDFQLVLHGRPVNPGDRNVWGVTFVDDRTFYATVGSAGRTWLVRGDLVDRTLTSLRQNAECPSLSPDGRTLAYKVDSPAPGTWWSLAVLDLATGHQQVLRQETANVDDQVEWLDDDTLLYGRPRGSQAGVTDVWEIDARADASPHLLIEQAWSPSVVRP